MTTSRAWLLVGIAGLLEVAWAMGLKYSEGFTRPVISAATLVAMAASMWLLSQALRVLPAGSGYAVWTGIGAVGTAILGIVLLGESRATLRLASIGLIVVGILGLRLTGE
ncbi:MAG: quaternary ammonium compound efflux SMR transporter SugE [Gemmatimonadota bacterium]